jgi:AmiR/NasT family two-component response regulator
MSARAPTLNEHLLAHFTVSGEAGYGIEAVTVAKEHMPDVFVVSVRNRWRAPRRSRPPAMRSRNANHRHFACRCRIRLAQCRRPATI